jgi:hypothetical protein
MAHRDYRPRRIPLSDGEVLALRRDGSISHLAEDGSVLGSWMPGDPEWAQRAIRFGLRESPDTVRPSGRDEPDRRPPA